VDLLSQQTLEVELPRSQGRRTLEVADGVVIFLLDVHRLLPTFARWHSVVPIVAQGPLETPVERVESQVDEMPHDNGLRIQGHHCTCPCLSEFSPSATR
jgi:hypothetical protein